eukprot:c20326_g1_i1.p1 GENE.c20326_g1_i1~~c20326_g1_i1.p1  ORF type:complete len:566 (+),score=119.18 c20326_g1_i1:37-1734(+)
MSIDGGKDSLSMAARVNQETVKAPGTLVISTYAPCDDITARVTPCFATVDGALLYIPLNPELPDSQGGLFETRPWRLGGTAFAHSTAQIGDACANLEDSSTLITAFNAIQALLPSEDGDPHISAGHDVSDGGLITTLIEMSIASDCGVRINFPCAAPLARQALLAEEPGVVVEVPLSHLAAVQHILLQHGVANVVLGHVCGESLAFTISCSDGTVLINDTVQALRMSWESTSLLLEMRQTEPQCVEEERRWLSSAHAPLYSVNTDDPAPKRIRHDGSHETSLPKAVNGCLTPLLRPLSNAPRVAVIREEGSNGDREMANAFRLAGFETVDVHMNDLRLGKLDLRAFRGVAFVGGFSYADALDSAKGWAASIRFNPTVLANFEAFKQQSNTFSLGVCNGAQLMMLLGWIPAVDPNTSDADQPRFMFNRSGRFESRFSTVRIDASPAVMLQGMEGQVLGVWVAHGEGRTLFPNKRIEDQVLQQGLGCVRYVDWQGNLAQTYPENPNGSAHAIAALCSPDGRHLAIMPHPERCFLNWQWPWVPRHWGHPLKPSPWMKMFENAYEWCCA